MLEPQRFFVREQVSLLKTTDVYDILDADTQQQVATAVEEPGQLVSLLRWVVHKKLMPTIIHVRSVPDNALLFTLRRPVSFWRDRVEVYDASGQRLGHFTGKVFTIGGGLIVFDRNGQQFADVKGDWVGWNFRFLTPDGQELGIVTKKWAGIGQELFTTADNYIVAINDSLKDQVEAKVLLLAAALAIDIVYYEDNV